MTGKFNHHIFLQKKVVIKSADHLSETFFNHHLLITMGPCLTLTPTCVNTLQMVYHPTLMTHVCKYWSTSLVKQTCGQARMLGNRFSAHFLEKMFFCYIDEVRKQYTSSLLDTIPNYMFVGTSRKIKRKYEKTNIYKQINNT